MNYCRYELNTSFALSLRVLYTVLLCHDNYINVHVSFRGVAPFRHCRHVPTHFFLKIPQNAAATIDICVIYRPDQPALSAQTDPADTFRLSGIDV